MKLVVFGLTVSSSWGNGHATLWRGLASALARRGHRLAFFERDAPWYARARDLQDLPGGRLHLYDRWDAALPIADRELAGADAAIVTSYCPDGVAACRHVLGSAARVRTFYDMDTPVTLERAAAGERVEYVPPEGLAGFDLVLSFTGGEALPRLAQAFGARRVRPLYGSVDPAAHRPSPPLAAFRGDLSYLGTWAANRQQALDALFLEPARRLPDRRFVLAGAQYGRDFPWLANVFYVNHLPPSDHPAFLCSSPLTLNVTRAPMALMGHCPSGRLFEAAACGVPVLSDTWAGLEEFFEPGREILVARSTEEAVEALSLPPEQLARVGRAARERTLALHTNDARAAELVAALEGAAGAGLGAPQAGGA